MLAGVFYALTTKSNKREPIIITSSVSYVEMSLDDLITTADLIVVGKPQTIHPSRWNTPDGKLPPGTTIQTITPDKIIFTDIDFDINQTIKGQEDQKSIRIRSLGGTVGQDRMLVNGVVLDISRTYLLFLELDKAGSTANIIPGHYWVIGGYQGVYEITDGKALSFRDEWQLEDLISYIQKTLYPETPTPAPTVFPVETPTSAEAVSPTP